MYGIGSLDKVGRGAIRKNSGIEWRLFKTKGIVHKRCAKDDKAVWMFGLTILKPLYQYLETENIDTRMEDDEGEKGLNEPYATTLELETPV